MKRNAVPAVLLIVVGAVLLAVNAPIQGGKAVVALIGSGFLLGYALTRSYGLLVPGGIMTGLGLGILAEGVWAPRGSVLIGLGAGFLAISVVERLAHPSGRTAWWPVIPGGVLLLVGALQAAGETGLLALLTRWWPAALVAAGLWLLLPRPGGSRRKHGA